MKADFLLVGRGLAGSVLALKLVQSGRSVISIDEPTLSASSRVAAGLINPMVFRKLGFAWRAVEALPEAVEFYSAIQKLSESRFFHQTGMCRIFGTEHEAQSWKELRENPEFTPHLGVPGDFDPGPFIHAPFGTALVNTAAYFETCVFLDAAKKILDSQATVVEDTFHPEEVSFNSDGIRYKDFSAQKLVLCEGWKAAGSLWFGDLPFRPAKGEILVVKAQGLPYIPFNGGVFGIPAGKSTFRIGSTYEWGQKDESPTTHQREDLTKRLSELLRTPFEIELHQAGIRPTVSDRRPLLGKHPDNDRLFVFNGLGTHGALMAPLLATEMTEFLLNKQPISNESSICRFH